ncbi:hypothetical protein [Peribacillus acanthi]|uniref:hypothetical protein n=1 Tax=Peribacillus acanthi TaxID=2171554 RepID=UPI000D3E9444|nr:hypothetical protein [Peribacillus acanthi]
MNYKLSKLTIFLTLLILLSACSNQKEVNKEEVVKEPVEVKEKQVTKEIDTDEEKDIISAGEAKSLVKNITGLDLILSQETPKVVDGISYYVFDPLSEFEKSEGISYALQIDTKNLVVGSSNGIISWEEYSKTLGNSTTINGMVIFEDDLLGVWSNDGGYTVFKLMKESHLYTNRSFMDSYIGTFDITTADWFIEGNKLVLTSEIGSVVFKIEKELNSIQLIDEYGETWVKSEE